MIEYLKNILNFGKSQERNGEKFGPTGLPRDVEDELINSRNEQNNQECPISHNEKKYHDDVVVFHPRFNQDFEFHVENMMKEFDDMFQNMFGGMHDQIIPSSEDDNYSDETMPGDVQTHKKEKNLRDKMLAEDENTNADAMLRKETEDDEDPFHYFFKSSRPRIWSFPVTWTPESSADQDEHEDNGRLSITDILRGRTDLHEESSPEDQPSNTIFPFFSRGFPRNIDTSSTQSSFNYSTVSQRVNSNGFIETVKKRKDGNGNEEVSTSRTIGDQTHTVTTKTNRNGEEERVESFLNMDEGDLKRFEEKWKEKNPQGHS